MITIKTHRLSWIYITALVLIAVLAFLSHSILLYLITSERASGALINLSGRQRMLTQRAAIISNKLILAPETDRAAIRTQLNDIAAMPESNKQLLLYGDPNQQLPVCPEPVRTIFFAEPYQLDNKSRDFTTAIRALTAESDASLTPNNPQLRLIENAALGELFTLNNQVVEKYQALSESRIDLVRSAETGVIVIILLALLLEGLYIFRPMVRRIEADRRQLEKLNEELAALSSLDGLTAVANRRHFDIVLQQEWQRHKREQRALALLMIDIDYFKFYNDTYGHQAGDDCLIKIARAIQTTLKRPSDLAARYGGEEFAVILPGVDQSGAQKVAERIRIAVEQTHIEHSGSLVSDFVTVSIGIAAIIPDDSTLPAALIKAADLALYAAKANGRNQVSVAADAV